MPKNIYLCEKCLKGGSFFPSSKVSTDIKESPQSYSNALLNGRNSYPPKERLLLSKIGNEIMWKIDGAFKNDPNNIWYEGPSK